MTPEEYTRQSATLGQAALSNVFMGLRAGQAERDSNRDFSLREKAFRIDSARAEREDALTLEKIEFDNAIIQGASAKQDQFDRLNTQAIGGDTDGLMGAKWTDVDLPGFNEKTQRRFNAVGRHEFETRRAAAQSSNLGVQHRRQDIEDINQWSQTLTDNRVTRGLASEVRDKLLRGAKMTDLRPDELEIVQVAGSYMTKKRLYSDPKIQIELLKNKAQGETDLLKNVDGEIKDLGEQMSSLQKSQSSGSGGFQSDEQKKQSAVTTKLIKRLSKKKGRLEEARRKYQRGEIAAADISTIGGPDQMVVVRDKATGIVYMPRKLTPSEFSQLGNNLEVMSSEPVAEDPQDFEPTPTTK